MKEKTIHLIPSLKTLHHLALAVILLAAVTVPVVSAITHISLPSPVRAMTGNGSADNPYMIYNLDDLQAVRYLEADAHYELANDIDASASSTLHGVAGLLMLGGTAGDDGYDYSFLIPDSDNAQTGSWTLTPSDGVYYTKVNDPPTPDETDYMATTTGSSRVLFNIGTPAIPAGSTTIIVSTSVRMKDASTGANSLRHCLQVGGTVYNSSTSDPGATWGDNNKNWATNPKTSLAWTVDDVNGVGANALQCMGYEAVDADPGVMVAGMNMLIDYSPSSPATDTEFSGVFNGAGYTISNLRMWRYENYYQYHTYQGIFGELGAGAVVANVTLSNVDFDFGAAVDMDHDWNGVLIGVLNGEVTISNCHITSGTFNAGNQCGPLIGMGSANGTVSHCTANVNCLVSGESGGLIGWAGWYGPPHLVLAVDNCSATGNISTTGTPTGLGDVGGLIGMAHNVTITNCYATGNVTNPGEANVGGLIGTLNNGTVSNCYATGDVVCGEGGGGFVGLADEASSTDITYCYATGDVIGTLSDLGGFAGINDATIEECFSTGNVICNSTSSRHHIGGFAGSNDEVILNCYSRGDVTTARADDYDIGGFVGKTLIGGGTDESYSTGLITTPSSDDVGGFCGDNANTVEQCFWDNQTSGYSVSDGGTGLPTANMTVETTFTSDNWDFDDIWCMPIPGCNDGYPILQNNLLPGCACMYLLPPENLIATPISSTRIDLSWYNPNSADDWPDLMVVLRSRTVTYPADPPSGSDSWLVLYRSAGDTGDDATSHINLDPGTTYFYRVWFYEPNLDQYTTYSQDFATTFAGVPPDDGDEPPEWFREPSCISYYNTPLWPAMNYAIITYEWPEAYFCMAVSLLLISIVCLLAYGVAAVGTQGSVKSIAVPFILGAGLIGYGGTAMSLFPLGITIVSFIMLGGIGVFVWTRA